MAAGRAKAASAAVYGSPSYKPWLLLMECIRPCPCPFRSEVLSVKRRRLQLAPVPTLPADSILNTGDAAALDALPGIGTVLSERIITYREEHGAFVYPEDLRNVQGIGAELQTKITDSLDDESTNPLIVPAAETTAVPRATLPPDSILNTGDADALDALPGIGTVLSERIVAYREEHGAFVYPEELRNVKGIGEKRLQAILDALAGESAEESD